MQVLYYINLLSCDHEDKGAKLTPGSWTDGAKLD